MKIRARAASLVDRRPKTLIVVLQRVCSQPTDGADEPRIGSGTAEFRSRIANVHVDYPLVAEEIPTPDVLDGLTSREDTIITMPAVIAPIQRNMACSFRFTTRSQQNRDEGTGVPPMKIQ